MEIGIYTITGTIAAASGVALARFPSEHHLKKRDPNGSSWTPMISRMPRKDFPEVCEMKLNNAPCPVWLTAGRSISRLFADRLETSA